MSKIDISAIINLHAEGMLAHSSFVSAARTKAHAERLGLQVEVLAVLDQPNADTLDFVKNCTILDFTSITVAHGDLGRARNSGIEAATGEWVSFLDGDDLWAESWLAAAYRAATNDSRPVVWHPRGLIMFGTETFLFIHVDMEDEDFELLGLSISNIWAAQAFARRELYLSVPYPPSDLAQQVGYEDWGWNMATIEKGYLHKVVPDVVNACRRKTVSLVQQSRARNVMPWPTSLFRNLLLKKAGASAMCGRAAPESGPIRP
jgi:glycosyltransferase involved in cell wall biosynthesis